jgi:hypothetical protein
VRTLHEDKIWTLTVRTVDNDGVFETAIDGLTMAASKRADSELEATANHLEVVGDIKRSVAEMRELLRLGG